MFDLQQSTSFYNIKGLLLRRNCNFRAQADSKEILFREVLQGFVSF